MSINVFNWETFAMDELHKQIQAKSVNIGFRGEGLTVHIHGKPGDDKDRPDRWTVFAVFAEDGKKERTMSRKLSPTEVTMELERSITSARKMMQVRVPAK